MMHMVTAVNPDITGEINRFEVNTQVLPGGSVISTCLKKVFGGNGASIPDNIGSFPTPATVRASGWEGDSDRLGEGDSGQVPPQGESLIA